MTTDDLAAIAARAEEAKRLSAANGTGHLCVDYPTAGARDFYTAARTGYPQLAADVDALLARIAEYERYLGDITTYGSEAGRANAAEAKVAALAADNTALRKRVSELEVEFVKPLADVWSGNHEGTPRIPWEVIRRAAALLADQPETPQ